jgi:hypothetical protein
MPIDASRRWAEDETLITDRVVVPLVERKDTQQLKSLSRARGRAAAANDDDNSKKSKTGMHYYTFGVDLGFGVTVTKVQGMNAERVLVDLESPSWSVAMLYVAMSRVRQRAHVRILKPSEHARERLRQLEFDSDLVRWWYEKVRDVLKRACAELLSRRSANSSVLCVPHSVQQAASASERTRRQRRRRRRRLLLLLLPRPLLLPLLPLLLLLRRLLLLLLRRRLRQAPGRRTGHHGWSRLSTATSGSTASTVMGTVSCVLLRGSWMVADYLPTIRATPKCAGSWSPMLQTRLASASSSTSSLTICRRTRV